MMHLVLQFSRLRKSCCKWFHFQRHEWNFIADWGKWKQKKAETITIFEQESDPFCVRTCRIGLWYTQTPLQAFQLALDQAQLWSARGLYLTVISNPSAPGNPPSPLCACLAKAECVLIRGILLLSSLLLASKSFFSAWVAVKRVTF